MITLTRELIHANKTANGGWTRAQVEALGVQWPYEKGWLSKLRGKQVTEDQWRAFMAGKTIRSGKLKQIKKAQAQPEFEI